MMHAALFARSLTSPCLSCSCIAGWRGSSTFMITMSEGTLTQPSCVAFDDFQRLYGHKALLQVPASQPMFALLYCQQPHNPRDKRARNQRKIALRNQPLKAIRCTARRLLARQKRQKPPALSG